MFSSECCTTAGAPEITATRIPSVESNLDSQSNPLNPSWQVQLFALEQNPFPEHALVLYADFPKQLKLLQSSPEYSDMQAQ
mmetsp:Transcript_11071/g.41317  ORF Transcript_11071/g.41317 Transcript_11071/m.41317 type:complete len:81 (-) Transcript_11071:3670-3912(-)